MINLYLKELVKVPQACVLVDNDGVACENQVVYATCYFRDHWEVAPCVGCPHREEF